MKRLSVLLLIYVMIAPAMAQQAPDFQLIMNTLQSKLDAFTTNAWTSTAYSYVVGLAPTYNPPFNQSHPSFAGRMHIENQIKDDDHLALLQKVLENDACVREKLGGSFVDNVRTTFFANQANVINREMWIDVQLFNSTRIDINYVISANNRPAWTDPAIQRFTTGANNNIRVCVDSGIFIVGTTCIAETAGINSLWTKDWDGDGDIDTGLLDEAAPGLGNDIRDLLAAYLTIGNQSKVDYMQAVIFQAIYRGLLPNFMDLIFRLLGKGGPWDASLEWAGGDDFTVDTKAYTPLTSITDVNIDRSYNPPFVVSQSDPYIAIRRVVARIYNSGANLSIQQGILQHFCHWYQVGANGFGTGYPTRLRASGDLDLNGQTNLQAYQSAGMNRAQFLVNAGAGILFGFNSQPLPPMQTLNYGAQAYFSAQAAGGTGQPIYYQWYSGPTPQTLQPVQGATGQSFNPIITFYSYGSTVNQMYYQCRATTFACGENITSNSNTVVVTGGSPPPIDIYDQPVGGSYFPGQTATLVVNAGVAAGELSYQWQKYSEEFENWFSIPDATSRQLVLGPLTSADNGQYRCQIFNQINAKGEKSNPVYWHFTDPAVINVAPPIVINPQPVGGDLIIGQNLTISAGASVEAGNLEYRWQKNPGTGFQNLTGWIDTGSTDFTTEWNIVGATIADSGAYRIQVRNTLAPFGTYSINSASAVVNVSSGAVFYVDPTGNNSNGRSWATAFWSLQDAIDAAHAAPGGNGGEVWVAGGPRNAPIVYNEPRTQPWGGNIGDPGRVIGSLIMKSNVALYGGFEGYRGGTGRQETNRLQRNRAQNVAIIDGSQARGGSPAYHVIVFGSRLNATVNAMIDGFIITGGNAAGIANDYHTWRGGGIYNYGSSPTIANCIITGNRAAVSGGGIANEMSSSSGSADAILINCLIINNRADRMADGGAGPGGGNPIRGGGGIFNNRSSSTTNFCTLALNSIDETYVGDGYGLNSAGIYTWHATPLVTNTIVWGNTNGAIRHDKPLGFPLQDTTVTYSDVQGGYAGTGNLNVNPLLGNAAYTALLGPGIGNFVPDVGSPVINMGDTSITGGDDHLGVVRPLPTEGRVDMGAFEYSANPPSPVCINIGLDMMLVPNTAAINPFDVYDSESSTTEAPIWKVQLAPKTFTCADIPTTTIQLNVTDILGRVGSCTANVTVTESQPPTPVCNNITVQLNNAGTYTLTAADRAALSAGSSDNCTPAGSLVVTVLPNTFTCAQAGQSVNVTVKVADAIGNEASCVAQVAVQDSLPPVPPASPAAIDVNLLPNGTYQLTLADLQALGTGTTDNCGVDINGTTAVPSSFTCANVGLNTIQITVCDVNGNTALGTADVNVHDVTPPVITGADASRLHVTITGTPYTLAMALTGVTAEDVCDGDRTAAITAEVEDAESNPVAFPIDPNDRGDGQPWIQEPEISYTFTLRYKVLDTSGNEAVKETDLVFMALLLPEITINGANPAYVQCPDTYVDAGATAWDPQNLMDITSLMSTVVAVNTGVPGNYTVTYSVPVPGYPQLPHIVAVRNVIVQDTLPPVITLQVANPLYWQRGESFPNNATIRTAWDACSGNLTNAIVTTGVVDTATLGTYNLQYDVVDGQSNPATTVDLTVIVIDKVMFMTHPQGTSLYTNDPAYTLSASYRYGSNVTGYEWVRNNVGLGFVPATDSPNTVTLAVNPAALTPGNYVYRVDVSDDAGITKSNNATVNVANRLAASALTDIGLQEGQNFIWTVNVTGGFGSKNYQWFANRGGKAWEPVVNGPFENGAYGGANTASLAFQPFTAAMAGQYKLEISDAYADTLVVGPATVTLDYGVPAVSMVGLAALAMATALGGAAALRKRK